MTMMSCAPASAPKPEQLLQVAPIQLDTFLEAQAVLDSLRAIAAESNLPITVSKRQVDDGPSVEEWGLSQREERKAWDIILGEEHLTLTSRYEFEHRGKGSHYSRRGGESTLTLTLASSTMEIASLEHSEAWTTDSDDRNDTTKYDLRSATIQPGHWLTDLLTQKWR